MHTSTKSSTYLKTTFSILHSFTLAITLLAVFCIGLFSCQKQFTLEGGVDPNDGIQAGSAVFSATGAPNACSVATLRGDYIAGTSVSDTCTVTVTVNVTDTGSYTISTNTANGLIFMGAGKFTATGTQTIQLTANGTPVAAGTFKYTAGTKGCSFTVVSLAAGSIQAEFTLSGAPTACTTDSVMGIYTTGLPLDAGNKVKITANVTKAGAYSISTATVNGITFSSSGNLAVGTQTIVLQGSGTPVATGTNSFSAGSGGCTFPVQV